jgi:hypothetical protein
MVVFRVALVVSGRLSEPGGKLRRHFLRGTHTSVAGSLVVGGTRLHFARMAHCHRRRLQRLDVVLAGAQEGDEGGACVLGTERHVAVTSKDRLDSSGPRGWREWLEFVAAGLEEIATHWDGALSNVIGEPWRETGRFTARARRPTSGLLHDTVNGLQEPSYRANTSFFFLIVESNRYVCQKRMSSN